MPESNGKQEKEVITVEPHVQPSRGPYHFNEPKKLARIQVIFIYNQSMFSY